MSQATFSRARSEDQREQRRETILSAAVELLGEVRVVDLSLNELSRRAGLAKSNVLRYFESREAVLLEVYERELIGWLSSLKESLSGADRSQPSALADAIASTAAARPLLAELCANAPGILEHNISGEVARDYKRALIADAGRLAQLAQPWIGTEERSAVLFAGAVFLAIGGIWASCRLSPGMLEAYELDPSLARYRLDFEPSLRETMALVIRGLQTR
jgi:AcrR family transcriptional regulator